MQNMHYAFFHGTVIDRIDCEQKDVDELLVKLKVYSTGLGLAILTEHNQLNEVLKPNKQLSIHVNNVFKEFDEDGNALTPHEFYVLEYDKQTHKFSPLKSNYYMR